MAKENLLLIKAVLILLFFFPFKAVRESAGKEDIKEPNCPFFKELDYIFNPSEAVVPPLFQTNSNSDVDGKTYT